jgi:hypothetical protein
MDDLRMASRVGVDHEKEVADSPIRTPPRKIRARFGGYKHTSLSRGNIAQDHTYQRLTEVNSSGVRR